MVFISHHPVGCLAYHTESKAVSLPGPSRAAGTRLSLQGPLPPLMGLWSLGGALVSPQNLKGCWSIIK